MSVKCAQILEILENIAPAKLAEDWDNIGLLLGGYDSEVSRILLALDVTEDTVEEAVNKKADLIISHHPLFFKPMKNLRWNDSKSILIRKLIKNDISVISAHTNLDSSPGGINSYLGSIFNLDNIETLSAGYTQKLYKIAVFTPADYVDNVKVALFKSGAGKIGNYQQCSYETEGKGQFLPLSGSEPFMGREGIVEFVDEIKIEVIVEEDFLGKAVREMIKAHPYEEPAYDIYLLENRGNTAGLGITGKLAKSIPVEELVILVKERLQVDYIRLSGTGKDSISKIAICSGAGADMIDKAKFAGAQALITGDVKYHDAQRAKEKGIYLIDAGHYPTEIVVKDLLLKKITEGVERNKLQVEIIASEVEKDFIKIV